MEISIHSLIVMHFYVFIYSYLYTVCTMYVWYLHVCINKCVWYYSPKKKLN